MATSRARDFAAVDAECRPLFAHDPARDFEGLRIVEGGGRGAVAVIDRNCHLGMVASRAAGIAGEDDVVHLGRAHGLVGGFAHDPAHRFDKIGLAAAVRADHAGQSRLDLEVGRLDKGFEADQAQPRKLHSLMMSMSLAAATKGIVEGSRLLACVYVERCRIGAENESSQIRAQQRRGVIQTFSVPQAPPAAARRCPGTLRRGKKPLSFLEIGVDLLGHRLDREIAYEFFSVDKKCRRGIDSQLFRGAVAHGLDVIEHLLIRQALVE